MFLEPWSVQGVPIHLHDPQLLQKQGSQLRIETISILYLPNFLLEECIIWDMI